MALLQINFPCGRIMNRCSKLLRYVSLHSKRFRGVVACVAGRIRERASGGRAAILPARELSLHHLLSRLRHSRSPLRYQNKGTRAQNPASYAGYWGWGAKKDQGTEPERYFTRAKLGREPK